MKTYLAGYAPKSREEQEDYKDWRKEYTKILKKDLEATCIEPGRDESDLRGIFAKDCLHIRYCDLVVVNGEGDIGVGTSQEIVIAKHFKKPAAKRLQEPVQEKGFL